MYSGNDLSVETPDEAGAPHVEEREKTRLGGVLTCLALNTDSTIFKMYYVLA